jgi:putative nucleotidyltransferase with HDIG domain
LARAVDAKDGVTHDHIRRVKSTALELATRLGVNDAMQLRAIETAALLHDVGKLAIPESILNKPGRLTPAEFERMKSHARIGAEILSEVDFPYPVVPIVRHHHENWDGTGYPDGLKGEAIPIGARILAVVDCFDALTSHRPYRRALSLGETLAIIDARRGTIYDPAIVEAFHQMHESGAVSVVTAVGGNPGVVQSSHAAANQPAAADIGDGYSRALQVGATLMCGGATAGALADALCELPDVDTVAVYVVDEVDQRLIPRAVSGRHAPYFEGLTIPVRERLSGWVAAVGETMINADAALDLFDVRAEELASALAVPYAGPNEGRGVVTLYSARPGAFTPSHERLVRGALALLLDRSATAQVIDIHHHGRQPFARRPARAAALRSRQ